MEEQRRNLLVGLFVLVGIVAGCTLIVLFGQAPTWIMQGDTYPLHVHFDEITGVREGNLVTVKGIEIGRVEAVSILTPAALEAAEVGAPVPETPREVMVAGEAGVDVRLAIKTRFRIPTGSSALTTEPMLGQGRPPIEIIPGPSTAAPLPAGAAIKGRVRGAIDSIFPADMVNTFQSATRQIGDAAEALTPVLEEMEKLLAQRAPTDVDVPGGLQGNISSAVARLDSSLKHFNEVLGDPEVKSQLRETIANVKQMSEQGKKVMSDLEVASGDARGVMDEARTFVKNADTTLTRLDGRVTDVSTAALGTLDRMDTFLDHLNLVGRQITSGQGNVGRLVMDDKLYTALVLTAERLAQAVEDFKSLVAEWREGKVRVGF